MSETVMRRVFYESPSTGTPRLVLLTLAFRCNPEGWCYPSAAWIAERAGLSSRSWVFKNLAKLEEAGEVVRVKRGNPERGNDSSVYLLPRYADMAALSDYLGGGGPYSVEMRKACEALGIAVHGDLPSAYTSMASDPGVGSDTRVVSDPAPAPGVRSDTLKGLRINDVTDTNNDTPPSPDGSGAGEPGKSQSVKAKPAGGGRRKDGSGSAARERDLLFDAWMRLHGYDPDKPPSRYRGLAGEFASMMRREGLGMGDMKAWYQAMRAGGQLRILRQHNTAEMMLQWARETGRAEAPEIEVRPEVPTVAAPAGAPEDWQQYVAREHRGRLVLRQPAEAVSLLGLPAHSDLPAWWHAGRDAIRAAHEAAKEKVRA